MLLVDSRAGSKELIKPLAKLLGADNVESCTLDYGDIAFTGRGEKDVPLDIGIEFKTIGDIAQCCRDGRFAGHQLPGMRKTYDYSWLCIEGQHRADDAGFVTTYQGPRRGWRQLPAKLRASELEKHILTFQLCGGVLVRYTNSRDDSVRFIGNLYRWWTDRSLDSHTSHLAVHQPAALGEVSPFRRAVMAWPGVGSKLSKAVEARFRNLRTKKGSVVAAALGEIDDWANLETVSSKGKTTRMGGVEAAKMVKFLRGE